MPSFRRQRPLIVVSGSSPAAKLVAAVWAAEGAEVVRVGPDRAQPPVNFTLKESTFDAAEAIIPGLGDRLYREARPLPVRLWGTRILGSDATFQPPDPPDHWRSCADREHAPKDGFEVAFSSLSHVLSAQRLDGAVEAAVKEAKLGEITHVPGWLKPLPTADGESVIWCSEPERGAAATPLCDGRIPDVVMVVEGKHSSTRQACGFEQEVTTPPDDWLNVAIPLIDRRVPAGNASHALLRTVIPSPDPDGDPEVRHAGAVSDGRDRISLTLQLPSSLRGASPEAVREYVVETAHQTTGLERAAIAAGMSEPAHFVMQGTTTRCASGNTEDGTVLCLLGDAFAANPVTTGGGVNTVISEVLAVRRFARFWMQSGDAEEAAQRWDEDIIGYADPMTAIAAEMAYGTGFSGEKLRALRQAELDGIYSWRAGNPISPRDQMEEWLRSATPGTRSRSVSP
jgi:hypothetical protein